MQLGPLSIVASLVLGLSAMTVAAADAAKPGYPLDCKVGPVERTFGNAKWLVYSCMDGKSLVFVAAPDSKASPFYFSLTPDRLFGEGTGNQEVTDAAYAEIRKISTEEAASLVQETLIVGSKK